MVSVVVYLLFQACMRNSADLMVRNGEESFNEHHFICWEGEHVDSTFLVAVESKQSPECDSECDSESVSGSDWHVVYALGTAV